MNDGDHEPRVPRLDGSVVGHETHALFERFEKARGNVPNLFRVLAHREPIGETLAAHMTAVMGPGTVPVLLKELLSVRVSRINNCEY